MTRVDPPRTFGGVQTTRIGLSFPVLLGHVPSMIDATSVALVVFDGSIVTVIVSRIMRPIVVKARALRRRRRNHRWVRTFAAGSSRPPVRDGSAPAPEPAGTTGKSRPIPVVSAVPNSERWRVRL